MSERSSYTTRTEGCNRVCSVFSIILCRGGLTFDKLFYSGLITRIVQQIENGYFIVEFSVNKESMYRTNLTGQQK
ncbi:Uncharacterised protein [Klebsiella pneumoniae]|nr:Uncharacterised protein [Klebsiella pneumoniae]SWB10206.1 Uncharacterised protein [Klebsiella pneumoniae]SXZ59343.1 Uncharacterised protein [Klebsiella pneumoniae]